jgi:hypothetical protein
MEIAIIRCCDLHGSNCEPEEPCCRHCTEIRHGRWVDGQGVQRHGHPDGETCSAPDRALDEILASPEHKRAIREVLESRKAAGPVLKGRRRRAYERAAIAEARRRYAPGAVRTFTVTMAGETVTGGSYGAEDVAAAIVAEHLFADVQVTEED